MSGWKAIVLSFIFAGLVGYFTTYSCSSNQLSYMTGVEEKKIQTYQERGKKTFDSAKEFGGSIADIVTPEEKDAGPGYDPQMMKDLQELLETYKKMNKNDYSSGPE